MTPEKSILWVLIAVVGVIVLLPLLMMAVTMPMMGTWGGGTMDGGMWGGMGGSWMWLLMWLLVVAVVGGLGYLLYRVLRRSADSVPDPALEELRVAYARGDLSDEEFEQRRERLRRKD